MFITQLVSHPISRDKRCVASEIRYSASTPDRTALICDRALTAALLGADQRDRAATLPAFGFIGIAVGPVFGAIAIARFTHFDQWNALYLVR